MACFMYPEKFWGGCLMKKKSDPRVKYSLVPSAFLAPAFDLRSLVVVFLGILT